MALPTSAPNIPKKKGLPVIALIGIGCGAVVIVGVVAFVVLGMFAASKVKDFTEEMEANPAKTAAETLVKLNPEIELVKTDESSGTITIREKKTGKVATFNYEDIQKGKWRFETEEGKVEFNVQQDEDASSLTVTTDQGQMRFGGSASANDVPDWVPLYPRTEDVTSAFTTSSAEGVSGAVTFTVPEDADRVVEYYRSWMNDNGYEVSTSLTSSSRGKAGFVSGRNRGENRSLHVTLAPEDNKKIRVAIQYTSGGS